MTIRLRPLIKPDGRISRIRLSEPLHCPAFVRDGLGWAIQRASEYSKHWWDYYLLRAISRSFTPLSRVRTSSAPSCRVEAGPITKPTQCSPTMSASDFRTDRRRLTGRTGLCHGLSFGFSLTHRFGSPRLSDACLPDVLATLTPTEFTGAGDCPSCEHRPSHNTPEARRLRAFNITRLIRCGSSSFRPVGSVPGLLSPPALRLGQAPGRSVANRPIRRVGLTPTSYRTLHGLLQGGLFIANERPQIILFVFRRRGFCSDNPTWNTSAQHAPGPQRFTMPRRRKTKRKAMIGVLSYKQATLTGFVAPADHSNPYIIP